MHFAIVTNALLLETKALIMLVQTLPTHTQLATCISNRTYLEMIATHRYLPLKMGGNCHALVLTFEYATPTSCTVYAIAFFAGLNGVQVD